MNVLLTVIGQPRLKHFNSKTLVSVRLVLLQKLAGSIIFDPDYGFKFCSQRFCLFPL